MELKVVISEDLHAALKAHAESQERSMAWVIRKAIEMIVRPAAFPPAERILPPLAEGAIPVTKGAGHRVDPPKRQDIVESVGHNMIGASKDERMRVAREALARAEVQPIPKGGGK